MVAGSIAFPQVTGSIPAGQGPNFVLAVRYLASNSDLIYGMQVGVSNPSGCSCVPLPGNVTHKCSIMCFFFHSSLSFFLLLYSRPYSQETAWSPLLPFPSFKHSGQSLHESCVPTHTQRPTHFGCFRQHLNSARTCLPSFCFSASIMA